MAKWTDALPWKQTHSIYADDGPDHPVRFTVEGVEFRVRPTDKFGCDTGRRRFEVVCMTCDEVVHEATTSATCNIESHLEEEHDKKIGWWHQRQEAASRCEGKHNWGRWRPIETQDDVIRPDADGKYWYYVRECQMLGCEYKQYANALTPVGDIKETACKCTSSA